MSKHAEGPREPTDCRLGEVHMPLQGQALKTVARPQAGEHPLETVQKSVSQPALNFFASYL
jgi:hypothetical protein